MNWSSWAKTMTRVWQKAKPDRPRSLARHASADDVRKTFTDHHDELKWLATLLTGDDETADKCVVDARALSATHNEVFEDWLEHWARRATIRCAIDFRRTQVNELLRRNGTLCPHGQHLPLSDFAKEQLRRASVTAAILSLDLASRFALVLRGIEGYSPRESALLIGADRTDLDAAYCAALKKIGQLVAEPVEVQEVS